ncbi:MAG: hypothetical protein KC912_18695 [Proteobacteria bacterium]|nr:hypothetical protein [Pseudomonadota bacterium]
MKPFALLRMPDGTLVQAGPGDLIGRLWTSAVCIADERISEAHAMISLRGGDLRLLCLRGAVAVAVGGALTPDPILEPGLVIELAPGLALTIEDVRLPTSVLALRGDRLDTVSLSGVCSLYTEPPRLAPGHRPDAAGWFFDDGHAWFFTTPGASSPQADLTSSYSST